MPLRGSCTTKMTPVISGQWIKVFPPLNSLEMRYEHCASISLWRRKFQRTLTPVNYQDGE
ncbi:unnamed protein product [Moneuplotes crassus]|uniref:Uncharacterized protein n=1 Tax=Euplotes crassus TaxID=5936 RepID=A0AAD1XMH2_EUPCR|nr:unnamed protein product [Moneuplotes crassus]